MNNKNNARLFVIAAPSGAGKTTLVKKLVGNHPDLRFSISYTTRKQRRTEVDGVDYLFIDVATFEAKRDEGELLEYAEVFDNYYATSRSQVEKHLAAGHNVVARDRLAGRAPGSRSDAGMCHDFHTAAVTRRTGATVARPSYRQP